MASFGDLKAQVANDLRRSNLPTEIAQAVLDAIYDYDTERFFFNEPAIYTLTTVAGTDEYTLAPQAPIQEFVRIDKVRAQVGNTWYTLAMDYPDDMEENYSAPSSGQPFRWSYHGNDLR